MPRPVFIAILLTAAAILAAGVAAIAMPGSGGWEKRTLRKIDERMAAKRYEEAERELRSEFPDGKRGAEAWLRLGICRSMREDFRAAESCFESGLRAAPGDPRLIYNQALLYDRMGEPGRAEEALRRVARDAPWFPEVRYHLGRLAEDRGDLAAADRYYVEELNLDPASQSSWKRHLLLTRQKTAAAAASPKPSEGGGGS